MVLHSLSWQPYTLIKILKATRQSFINWQVYAKGNYYVTTTYPARRKKPLRSGFEKIDRSVLAIDEQTKSRVKTADFDQAATLVSDTENALRENTQTLQSENNNITPQSDVNINSQPLKITQPFYSQK